MSSGKNGNGKKDTRIDPPGLFDPPPGYIPAAVNSSTSMSAYDSITRNGSAEKKRMIVYRYIESCGEWGATCDECEVALNMRHESASGRRRELALRGGIVKTPLTRVTRRGEQAEVWVAVPIGSWVPLEDDLATKYNQNGFKKLAKYANLKLPKGWSLTLVCSGDSAFVRLMDPAGVLVNVPGDGNVAVQWLAAVALAKEKESAA